MTTLQQPSAGEVMSTLMAAIAEAPFLEDRITEVADTLKAYVLLSEAQQEDLRALRDSALQAHREVTALSERNRALNDALHECHLARADDERARDRLHADLQTAIGDLARLLSYSDTLRTHHHDQTPRTAEGR